MTCKEISIVLLVSLVAAVTGARAADCTQPPGPAVDWQHCYLDGRDLEGQDLARARYVKTYHNADINDPLQYHLVINTSRMGYENSARVIGEAVLRMQP